MRFYILLFLTFVLAFTACDKDQSTEAMPNPPTELSGEVVTANFFGQLTNDQGEVVEDASVHIGNKVTTTDQEGLWSIDGARVIEDQAFIQFSSASHHKGSRTLLVKEGSKYKVDVELLAYSGTQTVDAAAGGMVSVSNSDATVSFPATAFAKTDGTPYIGSVHVEAAYLDPNEPSTLDRMPGDLRATSTEGEIRLLVTYGMVSVELFDDTGNELQLADGQTATISLPVAGEAAITAPATIPLWYFDEASAQWVEEGTATLQNGNYVGEVSHFTFWNCDVPTDFIRLCGTVEFQTELETADSTVAANLRLIIESTTWGYATGYTDRFGQFCGFIPANEILTLIVEGDCSQPLYTATIGPYSADADLGTIIIPLQQNLLTLTTVSGVAVCDGGPVSTGVARIYQHGSIQATTSLEADGSFTTSYISCDTSDVTVKVVNFVPHLESGDIVYAYSTNISTGTIEACSQGLYSYFELIIDGVTQLGDSSAIKSYLHQGLPSLDLYGFANVGGRPNYYGFNLAISQDPRLLPLTLGTRSIDPITDNSVMLVSSGNLPSGPLVFSTNYDLTISKLPTANLPYLEGSIGPCVGTRIDSLGNQISYDVIINFSARQL